MSILDSVPSLIGKTVGNAVFKDATLTRTASKVSDGRGGFSETSETISIRALAVDYSDFLKSQGGIAAGERKMLIQAHEIAETPKVGDVVTLEGRTWKITDISIDPAGAVYEARVA